MNTFRKKATNFQKKATTMAALLEGLRSGYTRVPRGFNISVAYCMYVAGASLCSYSVPELRWFLASILETRVVWVCGMRGAGNLTTLNVKSKRRASCGCG